jgi:succinate dehydrogenase/fumarate reductase-like Fe-S protein
MTTRTARLHIRRGSPGAPAHTEIFEVPFTPGQSLLDGLRWIRTQLDPTLAVRYSCINANACKECMIELEGKAAYACTERLREGDMQVAPLSNKALVHDLITEIAPRDERLLD